MRINRLRHQRCSERREISASRVRLATTHLLLARFYILYRNVGYAIDRRVLATVRTSITEAIAFLNILCHLALARGVSSRTDTIALLHGTSLSYIHVHAAQQAEQGCVPPHILFRVAAMSVSQKLITAQRGRLTVGTVLNTYVPDVGCQASKDIAAAVMATCVNRCTQRLDSGREQ